ncbi:ANKL1 protein, partial [Pitta sordida]|nr:ANKL1 protein [Pitta sordida]
PGPGGPRRALSFLRDGDTDGSGSSGLPGDDPRAGPLSSTRRSFLEEQELGGCCAPPWCQGCPPEPPWLQGDPGGCAVPPQPLASSTLLWDREELQEGPPSRTGGGRRRGLPWAPPKPGVGDIPAPSSQFGAGSGPTVLLLPGDPGAPPGPPSAPRGSPRPGMLEGGSGWQRPSARGTPQFQWPPRHLPAPQAPDSPERDLGTPTVLLSPAGCATHGSEGHREDEEQGQSPLQCHSPATTGRDGRVSPVSPRPLSDQSLRRRLRDPGGDTGRYSPELVAALRTGHVPDCAQDELALTRQFECPDRNRHWREGLLKSSFNYLLLDPRTTQDLPLRSPRLSPAERFCTFVTAVFYVGKGTRARPYCHLAEALGQHRVGTRRVGRAGGAGGRCCGCWGGGPWQRVYRRCPLPTGLQTLTNQRKGHCYGVAAGWEPERRRRLGVQMLHRAMSIFLAEGERQLRPRDIPGG